MTNHNWRLDSAINLWMCNDCRLIVVSVFRPINSEDGFVYTQYADRSVRTVYLTSCESENMRTIMEE